MRSAMANVTIHLVGPDEYDLLASLYNQVSRPPVDASYFHRRLNARHHTLCMVADLESRPVGFVCGYELRPSTYYLWLCGVIPDARELGVASQLIEAVHARVREQGYEMVRFECHNQARAMLRVAIRYGYDIVGIRWDSRSASNLVIFEKHVPQEG